MISRSWPIFLLVAVAGTVSANSRFESVIAAEDNSEGEINEGLLSRTFVGIQPRAGCYNVQMNVCIPGIHHGNLTFPNTTTTTMAPWPTTTTTATTTSTSTTTTTSPTTTTSSPTTTTTASPSPSPSPTPSCYNDQFDCPTTNYVCQNNFICTNTNTGRNTPPTRCSTNCHASSCPAGACRQCTTGTQKVCPTPTAACANNLMHCPKRNYYCNGALQCVSQTTGASEPATGCSTSCPLSCGTSCTLCAPSKICAV